LNQVRTTKIAFVRSVKFTRLEFFRIFSLVLIGYASLRLAWISDDALITLRTALNVSHGWGPGFNSTESVQAYTHPLWFLIWTLVGVATNQWILGILILSVALTSIAVGILIWQVQSTTRIIVITLALLLSNAFIEYSTSGLENPLSYLTLVVFGLLVRDSGKEDGKTLAFALGATAAAVLLTRLDLVLLILPIGLLAIWNMRKSPRNLGFAALTFIVPMTVWLVWTVSNYGTFLPNTFEAKRNVDIPLLEMASRGLTYLEVSFRGDPFTLFGILAFVILAGMYGGSFGRAGSLGVLIYLAYVVSNGGDFMAGRFLATPLLFSAMLVAFMPPLKFEGRKFSALLPLTIFSAMLFVAVAINQIPSALLVPRYQNWAVDAEGFGGVSDERGFYLEVNRGIDGLSNGMVTAGRNFDFFRLSENESSDWFVPLFEINRAAKNWPIGNGSLTLPTETTVLCGGLGSVGVLSGPTTHLIDSCALTDRFLANRVFRPEQPNEWRTGHFTRPVPPGYQDAIETNDPQRLVNPADRAELMKLWESIR